MSVRSFIVSVAKRILTDKGQQSPGDLAGVSDKVRSGMGQLILSSLYDKCPWGWARELIAFLLRRHDFLISYHRNDSQWVEWIEWNLRKVGKKICKSDLGSSSYVKHVTDARKLARHIIIILSPHYLRTVDITRRSSANSWAGEAQENFLKVCKQGIPVRVGECEVECEYMELVNVFNDERLAQQRLFNELFARQFTESGVELPALDGNDRPSFPLTPLENLPDHQYDTKPFIGRSAFLTELHEALELVGSRPIVVAITGLNGAGKTRTAIKYAHNYRSDYELMWWIDASSETKLKESFSELEKRISNLFTLDDAMLQSGNQTETEALEKLLKSCEPWLLIFDGSGHDWQLIKRYLPAKGKGHVLLTTEVQHREDDRVRFKELGVMNSEEAILFLLCQSNPKLYRDLEYMLSDECEIIKYIQEHPHKKHAKQVCDELGNLPLAIEQAGAYISSSSISISRYHEIYQGTQSTQNGLVSGQSTGIRRQMLVTVARTWKVAISKCRPETQSLLLLCAYLSSKDVEAIPEEVIESAFDWEVSTFRSVVDQALEFSLLKRDPEAETLIIHRLVHQVLREQLYKDQFDPEEPKLWTERALKAVKNEFCERYLPLALASLAYVEEHQVTSDEAIRLYYVAGRFLLEKGEYIKAQEFLEKSFRMRKESDNICSYPDLATCLNGMGELHHIHGRYREAEKSYQEALTIRSQSTPGLQNVDEATIYNNLGRVYEDSGNPKEAIASFEKALEMRRTQDSTSVEYAISLSNMAKMFLRIDYSKAQSLYKEAGDILGERGLLRNHPYMSQYFGNLAVLYTLSRDYRRASFYYDKAIKSSEPMLGPNRLRMASCFNNQAVFYQSQRCNERAQKSYENALNIYKQYEKQAGRFHPLEMYIRMNYSSVLKGRSEELRQNGERIKKIQEQIRKDKMLAEREQ